METLESRTGLRLSGALVRLARGASTTSPDGAGAVGLIGLHCLPPAGEGNGCQAGPHDASACQIGPCNASA